MTCEAIASGNATSAGSPVRHDRAEGLKHAVRFAVIGCCCAAADLPLFLLLSGPAGLSAHLAKGIGYLVGTLVGFVGNKFWTFDSRRRGPAEAVGYLLLYAVSLGVNVACSAWVLAHFGAGRKVLAFVVAAAVTTVLNFLGARFLVFREGIRQRRASSAFPRRGVMLKGTYRPEHGLNRMKHEGDVARARAHYFTAPRNLKFLLRHRYEWMNHFIPAGATGIEVGAGTGLSKEFIKAGQYHVTDLADHDWLDRKHVDALNTPFEDESLDFVVSSNMIHHVPNPQVFFREMARVLKPGGRLLIQEINASLAMRALLRLMRHEGYSYEVDPFDETVICTDPNDLWSANCAIPNLLFDDPARFERNVPAFRVVHQRFREFFCFINSGGVIAKTTCVPLPNFALHLLNAVDTVLAACLPSVFALQRQIVLEKRPEAARGRKTPASRAA